MRQQKERIDDLMAKQHHTIASHATDDAPSDRTRYEFHSKDQMGSVSELNFGEGPKDGDEKPIQAKSTDGEVLQSESLEASQDAALQDDASEYVVDSDPGPRSNNPRERAAAAGLHPDDLSSDGTAASLERESSESVSTQAYHGDPRAADYSGSPAAAASGSTINAATYPLRARAQRIGGAKSAPLIIIAAIAAIAIIAFLVFPKAITVTVNGNSVQLDGDRSLKAAVEISGVSVDPGDLYAVDGTLISADMGEPYSAKVDGEEVSDPDWELSDGDVLEIAPGQDSLEEYDAIVEALPYEVRIEDVGAIHKVMGEGVDGEREIRTGSISKAQVTVDVAKAPDDIVCLRYNADTKGEKVIALTFDDGPDTDYTIPILDTLAANNAKATFFTVGDRITGDSVDVVKRAYDEGHQISTHSWSHARGSGQSVDLSLMSEQEQIDEIKKGQQIIADITGAEPSPVVRVPGGNFPESLIANVYPYIKAEIGWNIDTGDWQMPGVDSIRDAILSADPGDIILMHDGGGDRSQTAEALAQALPQLVQEGYRFVTIDELLEISGFDDLQAPPREGVDDASQSSGDTAGAQSDTDGSAVSSDEATESEFSGDDASTYDAYEDYSANDGSISNDASTYDYSDDYAEEVYAESE